MVRATSCPSTQRFPPHVHGRSELVYVRSGTLSVTTGEKVFTVATENAILIPAGEIHELRMLSDADVLCAYVSQPPGERSSSGCRYVEMSNLLRELLQAAADLPAAYDAEGREGRIMTLIAEEIAWLATQPAVEKLQIRVPKDVRLLRLCREMLQQLDRQWSIDEAATAAGMGRRTFTRTFRREMGTSFTAWCANARLNAAVSRLNAGASITEVAFESGYNSPSAFATMFKRSLGVAPSSYQTSTPYKRAAGC